MCHINDHVVWKKNDNPAKKKKADSADSKQGSIKGFFLKSCSKQVVEIRF